MSKQALNNRAMLVNTTVRQWFPVKVDRKVSDEVSVLYQSSKAMGRYHKRLVSKDAMKDLTEIRNQIRATHYFMTLPWMDDGARILSNDAWFKYTEKIRRLKEQYDVAAEAFMLQYPAYVARARRELNGLFNEADYPVNIREKFGVDIQVMPIPDASDFRVEGLDSKTTEEIKAQIQRDTEAILAKAQGSIWERLRDVLEHAVERLRAYSVDPEGKVSSPFRDSLVQNITDLLDIVPALNITKDPELDKFTDLIRKHVAAYDPDTLRDNEVLRESVATKAEKILDKMKGFAIQ